jgi:curved DNA-binding protein CbpA
VSNRRRFDPSIDYYAILEIAPTASAAEITRSYRRLMRGSHPDRFSDPAEQRRAEERAKDLNAAYAILSRPATRRDYDAAARDRLETAAIRARYSTSRPTNRRRAPTYTQQRAGARRRTPAPAAPIQKTSFAQATRRLLGTFLAAALALMLAIVLIYAAVEGLGMLGQSL